MQKLPRILGHLSIKKGVATGNAFLNLMKNKLTIYYSGNSLLEDDSMPFLILPELEKRFPEIIFAHHDPSENLPTSNGADGHYDIIIIDTVINTDNVICINDEKQLSTESVYSPHDWDLALNLKLLLKLGVIKNFLIIGVPPMGNLLVVVKGVSDILGMIDARRP